MSFGWSVGDIFTAIEIIYECSNALRTSTGSPEDRIRANEFVSTFRHTITVVQQIYGPNLPFKPGSHPLHKDSNVAPPTEAELDSLNALKSLYDSLKDEIVKYAGMNRLPSEDEKTYFARQAQKLKWHFFAKKTVQDLKGKITDQITLLQPALAERQFRGIVLQASLYHEETSASLDDVKTMLRVMYAQFTTNSTPPPTTAATTTTTVPNPNEPLSRASTLLPSPDDYTAYTTANQQLSPFIPPLTPPSISASLTRLRVTHQLRLAVKTWLITLDSCLPTSNILWLLDSPPATQCSAIIQSVLTELDRPVLSFSASHVDWSSRQDIPPEILFRNMLYSFLSTLLTYLVAHPESARQRIDAPSFASLDGSSEPASLSKAIMLLGNLLDNLPMPCVLIVDNAQHLDKPASHPLLTELLGLFARRPDRMGATMVGSHKLLLTTRGMSGFLGDLGMNKGLSRLATKDGVVTAGGYVLWDEVKTVVEGMAVREGGKGLNE